MLLFKGYGVSIWDDEKLGKWTVVIVIQHCECT